MKQQISCKIENVGKWIPFCLSLNELSYVETVSPEGLFCDTVQVPSGAGDMQLI